MELPIGNNDSLGFSGQALFKPGEQFLLKFQVAAAFVRNPNPAQRQRSSMIGN